MQEDNTMGMRVNAELPLPADLKNEYPLSDKLKAIKAKRDEEIRDPPASPMSPPCGRSATSS